MNIQTLKSPKTKEEARQKAIDWQQWQAEKSLSYEEMLKWTEYFQNLASKFDLFNEFFENGII